MRQNAVRAGEGSKPAASIIPDPEYDQFTLERIVVNVTESCRKCINMYIYGCIFTIDTIFHPLYFSLSPAFLSPSTQR